MVKGVETRKVTIFQVLVRGENRECLSESPSHPEADLGWFL
jgi:hypothetical protein